MYTVKSSYGSEGQITFENDDDFYKLLGYLCKPGATRIVWEHNEQQGAWTSEGRIQFIEPDPGFGTLKHTAGVGNILYRVNCNEFVEDIRQHFGFVNNAAQNMSTVRALIPPVYIDDFDYGYNFQI